MEFIIIALAFAAYVIIVVTASGSLRCTSAEKGYNKCINSRSATAWGFALLSTFGLPWGGVPLSHYLGVGSWIWFLFAGISICVLKNDGKEWCMLRRCFAIVNVIVIMTAFYVYMFDNCIPGNIPGIEGVGAINTLLGLIDVKLRTAQVCFFMSAMASFLPVYSRSERALVMLSFSYASFLAITFLPSASIFFSGIRPDTAILVDAAAYFIWALLIHFFIMCSFSKLAASVWSFSYAVLNAVLTAAGICFLFTPM